MYRLNLVAEFHEAETREEAEKLLDGFREGVQPFTEYGISIYLQLDEEEK